MIPESPALLGGAVGLLAATGLWLIYAAVGAARPTLVSRLAPLLDPTARARATRGGSSFSTLLHAGARDLGTLVSFFGSSPASVTARLRALGSKTTVGQFRVEQLSWAAVGLAGALLAVPFLVRWGTPAIVIIAFIVTVTVVAALLRDSALTWHVKRHRQEMERQLPDIAELLGLALSAGEGPVAALARVSAIGSGALAIRLRAMLASVHAGRPLPDALTQLAKDTDIPAVERLCDSIITALDRGTPLAEVLTGLAEDLRAEYRDALMEEGGKREIGMLVPVVFLIMPISVLFALFPGIYTLNMIIP